MTEPEVNFSRRQREAYQHMRAGLSTRDMARQMNITLPTAKEYRKAVRRKLGTLAEILVG